MCGIIHITKRRNLLYVIYSMIYYFLRKVDLIIINKKYKYNDSLIFTLLMILGEFFGGFTVYIYLNHFSKQENNKAKKHLGIELIQKNIIMKSPDSKLKIILLLFFTSYFDFVEFVISSFYMPKYQVLSPTAESRFGGGIIILAALICHFVLRIKILKHQFYSLIIIGICLATITALEIIYRGKGSSISDFCFAHLLVLAYLIFVPFADVIEKYLIEFNFINPFLILMIEALFGFIFVGIYSTRENPFKGFKRINEEYSTGEFILFIFLLFVYFVLSAGSNIYRILTNGLFSPMVKTLSVYILNPFIYIYYFVIEYDFLSEGERNWIYFIVNITISIIISFFGCVFNEFLVLSFCGLDHETHYSVSKRATDEEIYENSSLLDDSDVNSEGLEGIEFIIH